MGKLPGLVNYSDEEDQSSSDEDKQQLKQSIQSQPQTTQPQHQTLVTQKPALAQSITPPDQQQQQQQQQLPQTKSQDSNGVKSEVESFSATQGVTASTLRIKPPPSVSAARVGDRSTQLKTILTPKPLPGVENWGIPPEPQLECDTDRLEKIKHYLSVRQSGHRLNDHLQRNKAFRNPRIYAKLVELVDLNETGSNFPTKDFDPNAFPASFYIDGILETQKKMADEKAQQQAQGRSQLSFVPSSSSNKPAPASSSLDANAKFAAAMANAAKIANKIAKPVPPQQQQQQQQQQRPPVSPPKPSSHDHNDHSRDRDSSHKRSSHRQWDRRDDKRRHRY